MRRSSVLFWSSESLKKVIFTLDLAFSKKIKSLGNFFANVKTFADFQFQSIAASGLNKRWLPQAAIIIYVTTREFCRLSQQNIMTPGRNSMFKRCIFQQYCECFFAILWVANFFWIVFYPFFCVGLLLLTFFKLWSA